MINLNEKECKELRDSILKDLYDPEVKTPADKIKLKLDVLMSQSDTKKTDMPGQEVGDVTEEDIGEFPTVH